MLFNDASTYAIVGRGHAPADAPTNIERYRSSRKRYILRGFLLCRIRYLVGGVVTPPYNGVWNSNAKR